VAGQWPPSGDCSECPPDQNRPCRGPRAPARQPPRPVRNFNPSKCGPRPSRSGRRDRLLSTLLWAALPSVPGGLVGVGPEEGEKRSGPGGPPGSPGRARLWPCSTGSAGRRAAARTARRAAPGRQARVRKTRISKRSSNAKRNPAGQAGRSPPQQIHDRPLSAVNRLRSRAAHRQSRQRSAADNGHSLHRPAPGQPDAAHRPFPGAEARQNAEGRGRALRRKTSECTGGPEGRQRDHRQRSREARLGQQR
jgi:hypothetical protein